jgi:hypothetical protein
MNQLLGEFTQEDFLCPICEYEFTHINDVKITNASNKGINISCDGEDECTEIKIVPNNDNEKQRRHTIHLIGSCENGCNFKISFNQHKGVTYTTINKIVVPNKIKTGIIGYPFKSSEN